MFHFDPFSIVIIAGNNVLKKNIFAESDSITEKELTAHIAKGIDRVSLTNELILKLKSIPEKKNWTEETQL